MTGLFRRRAIQRFATIAWELGVFFFFPFLFSLPCPYHFSGWTTSDHSDYVYICCTRICLSSFARNCTGTIQGSALCEDACRERWWTCEEVENLGHRTGIRLGLGWIHARWFIPVVRGRSRRGEGLLAASRELYFACLKDTYHSL